MWIAKNSITGTTYGKKFSSIYDCQNFINNDLQLLEYHLRCVEKLEQDIIDELKFNKWYKEKYKDNSNFSLLICARIEYAFNNIFDDIVKPARNNNIIRCWYVEQERFADGFDF